MGLAAPQVGINVRLMVFNPEGEPGQVPSSVACQRFSIACLPIFQMSS